MKAEDVVRLCSHYRLARMLEREDFRSRLDKELPISVHELLYPLLTAFDAVSLVSDVELGATEQKFNLLVHREIQREYDLAGQAILMMSIPDELMWCYYELLTDRVFNEIVLFKKEVSSGKLHPMDAKMRLAEEVICDFHGKEAAQKAAENFQRVFRDRQAPKEAPTVNLHKGSAQKLTALLVDLKLAPSKAEAERLIKQKAVEIDGLVIEDPRKDIDLSNATSFLLRAGKKRFVRVIVQ